MKQTKNFLLMAAMLLCSISVSAEAVQIDGIWYNLVTKAKQAEVTGTKYTGSVTIPSTVTYDNVEYSVTSIGEYVFYNCSSLTAITIPGSITSIGDEAFYGCSGLTSITILDGVTSIGTSAFRKCSSLTSIIIPESVTSIGPSAFDGCSGLASVTIPEGVTEIGYRAFRDCSSLTSITIPESVTSIGTSAFYGCKSLTSVHISSIEAWCNIAFGGFESNPFSYAHDLYLKGELVTDLMIPEGVTSIREFAFHNYCNLISITIPESVTEIGDCAFHSCSSLTSIIIPESVTSIGPSAFDGCKNLASIVLPKSIRYVSGEAFANCPELLNVYCNAESVPSTEADAFDGSYPEYATLYVPVSAIENYKTTAPWSSFGKIAAIETSGIENADADAAYASPVIYDLSGRRMTHPEKGIYIINGCKVVIK